MLLIIPVIFFFIIPTLKWQLIAVIVSAAVLRMNGRARNHEVAHSLGIEPITDAKHFLLFVGVGTVMVAILLSLHSIRRLIRKKNE
ncbi:MAG: hypothetical protein JJU24_08380 [Natronohydrobacter sp.]|nr:hypothetical protein [Natronohydrobacter sp.]